MPAHQNTPLRLNSEQPINERADGQSTRPTVWPQTCKTLRSMSLSRGTHVVYAAIWRMCQHAVTRLSTPCLLHAAQHRRPRHGPAPGRTWPRPPAITQHMLRTCANHNKPPCTMPSGEHPAASGQRVPGRAYSLHQSFVHHWLRGHPVCDLAYRK